MPKMKIKISENIAPALPRRLSGELLLDNCIHPPSSGVHEKSDKKEMAKRDSHRIQTISLIGELTWLGFSKSSESIF